MSIFSNLFHDDSIEELKEKREKYRLPAIQGNKKAQNILDSIDEKMIKKMNDKYKKENLKRNGVSHSHGWYLESDD